LYKQLIIKLLNMKNVKFIIAIFAAILFSAPTFAQHHERHGHGMKHIMSQLDLTDAQKEQMKTLRETHRQKADALRSQDGDHTAKREQLKQLRDEQEAAFKNILTSEQIAKMEAMKVERKAKKEAFKSKMKNVDKKSMKEEMKAYKKENIAPVLLQQRIKLESAISTADKAQINELRATLKAAKKDMKAKKETHKEKGERPTKAEREQWKAMKEKYRPQHEQAEALVDKYDTQITALFSEVESERNEWKEDMKGIKDKYFSDLAEEFGENPRGKKWGKKHGDRDARKGKRHHDKGEEAHHRGRHHKGDKEKIAFLLIDVEKSEKRTVRKGRKANAIKVFPNPSATTNSIEYSVKEAGNIKIELHDKSGNIVKEIISEYKTPGTYTETINLNGLRDIVYFYVITDKDGVRSEKFMVKQ